jgi:thiol-disulfide isomerase/thioredoxin
MKLLYLIASFYLFSFTAYAQLRKNSEVPNFNHISYDGSRVRLKSSKSRVTIINFWASWCGPCLKSLDHTIIPLYDQYDRSELNVIGISNDLEEEKWRKTIEKYNIPWVNIWDEDRSLVKAFQVPAIPTYFLVNQEGIIINSNVDSKKLKTVVRKALKN